ncbi:hypothetical protein PUN28_000276 [Cardiocondyla obscurior]|uniref:Uncharacterized protein n=1 Tax=Cardiocondyla obscurior TaxID=286306 RepID=A0AAW2GZ38_9HYME
MRSQLRKFSRRNGRANNLHFARSILFYIKIIDIYLCVTRRRWRERETRRAAVWGRFRIAFVGNDAGKKKKKAPISPFTPPFYPSSIIVRVSVRGVGYAKKKKKNGLDVKTAKLKIVSKDYRQTFWCVKRFFYNRQHFSQPQRSFRRVSQPQ